MAIIKVDYGEVGGGENFEILSNGSMPYGKGINIAFNDNGHKKFFIVVGYGGNDSKGVISFTVDEKSIPHTVKNTTNTYYNNNSGIVYSTDVIELDSINTQHTLVVNTTGYQSGGYIIIGI